VSETRFRERQLVPQRIGREGCVARHLLRNQITQKESIALLRNLRWPDGLICPRCAGKRVSELEPSTTREVARPLYQCSVCRYQYSTTVGTPFHNSHIPLETWFVAIWLLSDERYPISVRAIQRMLKIPYKTAWSLVRRIKGAMSDDEQIFEDPHHTQAPQAGEPRSRPLSGRVPIFVIAARLRRILGTPYFDD